MLLFYLENLALNKDILLPDEEAKHCLKVLRMKNGDELHLTDGKGNLGLATIVNDNPKKCLVRIKQLNFQEKNRNYYIHVAIAPTKNIDRIEWFVEKCVEMGIDELSFLQTEHTERSYFNEERIVKKAISAMKQSLNLHLPVINSLQGYDKFIKTQSEQSAVNQKFIAYVDRENTQTLFQSAKPQGNYCVLIGPEGDFSPTELSQALAANFTMVSLGKSRLRTETAGLVACHTLHLLNE
jgi:16S rRNA (uracil1498-N3)-methyltransferase